MDPADVRKLLERHWEYAGRDEAISHEVYHDDAILEFPQSGERFLGKASFQAFRQAYPATVRLKVRRITGAGDLWVAENLISYDGGDWMFTVNILQFRGAKVSKEYIYVMDGFEAPEWRAPWADYFDPLATLE
jgi:hypothetical protein